MNFYPCLEGTYVPGTCRTGSRWAERIQQELANLTLISYNISGAFHPVDQTKPLSNLPYIFNNCSSPTAACNLTITVVHENRYDRSDGLNPESAR